MDTQAATAQSNPQATPTKSDPQAPAAPGQPLENPPAREVKPLPGTVPTAPSVTPGPPQR